MGYYLATDFKYARTLLGLDSSYGSSVALDFIPGSEFNHSISPELITAA
jgi:hypothetical protein